MIEDWKPQPKQQLALVQTADEILYGGARGGGKTDTGMAWLLYNKDNPRFRGLVIRRNAEDLRDWLDRARQFYAGSKAEVRGNTSAEILFPSGAIIRTGHLKDDNAYTKYQGHEYQNILIEELTHISSEDNYEKLLGSCRSTVAGIKPQIFATTNADGDGFSWVKARWNIPDEPSDEPIFSTDANGRTKVFIFSKLEDNPILMAKDPKYSLFLESIKDPDLKKSWRYGYWGGVSIKGAYYAEHMSRVEREGRVQHLFWEPRLPVHTIWDLGVGDNMAIGCVQVLGQEIRFIDYLSGEGKGMTDYIKVLKEKPYIFGKHFGPHDIETPEISNGVSRKDTAAAHGFNFQVVPNLSVADGIDAVRNILHRCYFEKTNCKQLVNGLKNYKKKYNERTGEYQDEPVHNWASHPSDMVRYAAISLPEMTNDFETVTTTRKPSAFNPFNFAKQ